MTIRPSFSLRAFNTFGLDVKAAAFAEVASVDELRALLSDARYRPASRLVLGGGSNLLFTGDFDGLVVHLGIKGIETVREDGDHVWIRAGGGEIWHDLVLWCLDRGHAGIENLSLIPGSVGAAPVQNIGAYGMELKETFEELEAVRLDDAGLRRFSNAECRFGYRDSVFKHEAADRYAIVSVTLRLNRKPVFHLDYGAVRDELKAMAVGEPGIRAISEAVIAIRRRKLPDPAVIGNAGSFFKNPEVPTVEYKALKRAFPGLVAWPGSNGRMKLAAGWLIERCGWKGRRIGRVGMHERQALVLVNHGGATGPELLAHAVKVRQSVKEKFGIDLETEVRVV